MLDPKRTPKHNVIFEFLACAPPRTPKKENGKKTHVRKSPPRKGGGEERGRVGDAFLASLLASFGAELLSHSLLLGGGGCLPPFEEGCLPALLQWWWCLLPVPLWVVVPSPCPLVGGATFSPRVVFFSLLLLSGAPIHRWCCLLLLLLGSVGFPLLL